MAALSDGLLRPGQASGAARAFTITTEGAAETVGDGLLDSEITYSRFVWTAENGAMPRGEISFPSTVLRTKRTDYTGNANPTEQVLGSNLGDSWQVSGEWDRRRMGLGVPDATKDAIERFVRSGVRAVIQLDDQRFVGLIKQFDPIMTAYGWRYTLTISPHGTDSGERKLPGGLRGQTRIRTPDEHYADVYEVVARANGRQSAAPLWAFAGSYHTDMGDVLLDLSDTVGHVAALLNAREDGQTTSLEVVRGAVALFALAQTQAATVAAELKAVSSAVILAWDNPAGVLSYEAWARGVAADMRECQWRSHQATIALGLRVDPSIRALYKPRAGESLYAIARKFFGDGLLWREIMTRNQLEFTNLQGTETLVIPALGGAA